VIKLLNRSPSHPVGLEHERFNPIQVPVVFRSPSHAVGSEREEVAALYYEGKASPSHTVGLEQEKR